MAAKNIIRNLKKIFDNALVCKDYRLALQAQMAISKHYIEQKKTSAPKKHCIQNIDLDSITEDELIKLIQAVSEKLQLNGFTA